MLQSYISIYSVTLIEKTTFACRENVGLIRCEVQTEKNQTCFNNGVVLLGRVLDICYMIRVSCTRCILWGPTYSLLQHVPSCQSEHLANLSTNYS